MSHETIVVKEKYQLITFVDETVPKFTYQLVIVYLFTGCPLSQDVDDLSHLSIPNIRTIITGDFNFNKTERNSLSEFLKNKLFSQMVPWPTHNQGRTLDHCYISKQTKIKLTRYSPYYSDHSALCIEFKFD